MASITEHFIRGSNNVITLTLTEDDSAISGDWTELDIWIGSLQINRASDGAGVALNSSTGVLTINPGDLSEDLSSLVVGRLYRVQIVVKDAVNDEGAVFGGDDSETKLLFQIGEAPA